VLGPRVARTLSAAWRDPDAWLSRLLLPLAALFGLCASARRYAYRKGWFESVNLPVPVLVIGNITTGGSGKSPLVRLFAQRCQDRGLRVGIICRGYGGQAQQWPIIVTAATPVTLVGDEAVMLARLTGLTVAAGPDRIAAGQALLKHCLVDVLISDDGLQHYRLKRDAEVAVVAAKFGFGNARLLPAGPLREPERRLRDVDAVMFKDPEDGRAGFVLQATMLRRLSQAPNDGHAERIDASRNEVADASAVALAHWCRWDVAAITAIGHPRSFFDSLRTAGFKLESRAFPDHHHFVRKDLDFAPGKPLLVTEKDAVKIDPNWHADVWVVETLSVPNAAGEAALERVVDLLHGASARAQDSALG